MYVQRIVAGRHLSIISRIFMCVHFLCFAGYATMQGGQCNHKHLCKDGGLITRGMPHAACSHLESACMLQGPRIITLPFFALLVIRFHMFPFGLLWEMSE